MRVKAFFWDPCGSQDVPTVCCGPSIELALEPGPPPGGRPWIPSRTASVLCAIYVQPSWMWQHLWHVHSPGRFNLAPEALRFIDIELALSRQGSENVLLQPDGLCSVPAVRWLLSARDTSAIQGTCLQISTRDQGSLKYNFCAQLWVQTVIKTERKTLSCENVQFPHFLVMQLKWIYLNCESTRREDIER